MRHIEGEALMMMISERFGEVAPISRFCANETCGVWKVSRNMKKFQLITLHLRCFFLLHVNS